MPSAESKAARIPHHVEIAHVEVKDAIGDHQHYTEIDRARRPPGHGVEFARAFFLVIGVQAPQGAVKLSADFARRILAHEEFWKPPRLADCLSGCLASVHHRAPSQYRPPQRRGPARRRRHFPGFDNSHPGAQERLERGGQPPQRQITPGHA
jgi:hypothetical protein